MWVLFRVLVIMIFNKQSNGRRIVVVVAAFIRHWNEVACVCNVYVWYSSLDKSRVKQWFVRLLRDRARGRRCWATLTVVCHSWLLAATRRRPPTSTLRRRRFTATHGPTQHPTLSRVDSALATSPGRSRSITRWLGVDTVGAILHEEVCRVSYKTSKMVAEIVVVWRISIQCRNIANDKMLQKLKL